MKVVSFLGTTDYQEVVYTLGQQECPTRLFPLALCEFFRPTELLVFLTRAAYDKWGTELAEQLRAHEAVKYHSVLIPDGSSEAEIWGLFDIITDNLAQGDSIVFDVTHGYRSLPVLATFAAFYLRIAKGVQIERMVYGAYDARNRDNRAPVFDLSPFLTLLDWTTATDQFLKTGNASRIVLLLEQAQNLPYRADAKRKGLPVRLKSAAAIIRNATEAIRVVRPYEAMKASANLLEKLSDAQSEVAKWAKPFALLLEQTLHDYTPFALDDPESNIYASLAIQLKLLRWYVDRDQTVEAVILAREWVVTLVVSRLGWDPISEREIVEGILNAASDSLDPKRKRRLPTIFQTIDKAQEIAGIWNELRDLRNDVAHVGWRLEPRLTQSIIQSVARLPQRLATLSPDLVPSGDVL